jgi:hypothetical protein
VLLTIVAALALTAPAGAAEDAPQVPAAVVQPLGEEAAAVVPYRQLVGAADARRLNAAVVDTSAYWVAAVDRAGRVIAARIPRPKAGRDFAAGSRTSVDGAPSAIPGPSSSPPGCARTASRSSPRRRTPRTPTPA